LTLRDKAIKGASWSLFGHIIQSISSFIIGIILARLLTPSEYGLIGMAGVFIFVTYVFVDSGFSTALIQRENCTNTDFSTVFYVNLAVSLLFFFLLYFTSGLIADFFSEPELVPIIKALSFLIILYALSLVHRSIINRRINLKLLSIVQITSQILSGTIGIILAYKGYGVWSLVWKTLLNQLFFNIQLWIFNRWHPTLDFSIESLKQMFAYSSKLLISGIINKIYEQLYNLIIGKYFSAKELGLYTRANQFKNLPSESLSGAIMSVSFPVFSQLQHDPVKLKRVTRKIIKATMFINIMAMLGMAAISKELILSLVGIKWIDATIYLQLLCVVGLFYPLHPINLNVISALGRSDLFLKLEIFKKLLAIPVILLGIFTNVKIMIVGMIFTSITAIFINSYYSKSLIDYGIKEQFYDISGSLLAGITMSIIVFLFGYFLREIEPKILLLIIQVLIGVVITIIISASFKMDEYLEFKNIVVTKILKKR